MFCCYDAKAEYYMTPFLMNTRGEALRAFQDIANDPQSAICKHPEDFSLFEIGEYDSLTGRVENLIAPLSLGKALEFKRESGNINLIKEG